MGLIGGYESWFGKDRKQRACNVGESSKKAKSSEFKLIEAIRIAYQIEMFVRPLLSRIKFESGEETFERTMDMRLAILRPLPLERIVDEILATSGKDTEDRWAEKPLRYLALTIALQKSLKREL